MRIRRSVGSDSRLTVDGVVQILVLTNEEIERGSRREIELEKQEALDPDNFEWP